MTDEDDEVKICDLHDIFYERSHQLRLFEGYDNKRFRFEKIWNFFMMSVMS